MNLTANFRAIGILAGADELRLSDQRLTQIGFLTLASWELWVERSARWLVLPLNVLILVLSLPVHLLEGRYRLLERSLAVPSLHGFDAPLIQLLVLENVLGGLGSTLAQKHLGLSCDGPGLHLPELGRLSQLNALPCIVSELAEHLHEVLFVPRDLILESVQFVLELVLEEA